MLDKPGKQRAAILGGLIIGAISGLPLLNFINCCCCAGILFGGAMTVYLYRQEFTDEMPPMESSDAIILGIIAGIVGAVITTLLNALMTLVVGPAEMEMVRGFLEKITQQLENNGSVPQGTLDSMREQIEKGIRENGSLRSILSSLAFSLVLYPIFAMLGGLIGYSIFGKKKTQPPLQP